MNRQERLALRDKKIKDRTEALQRKYPHWRMEAIIDKLSKEFFLSPSSIYRIIGKE